MIYIDCSEVVRNPHLNTGIQRVVRNISSRLAKEPGCQLVAFLGFGFVAINDVPIFDGSGAINKPLRKYRTAGLKKIRSCIAKIKLLRFVYRFLFLPAVGFFRRQIQYGIYLTSKKTRQYELVKIQRGDVLVLLDSNWHSDTFNFIKSLERRGVKIIPVIYDLIPIEFSQYCDELHCMVFKRWLRNIISISNSIVTISADAKKTVLRHIDLNGMRSIPIDYFYLGSDFNGSLYDGIQVEVDRGIDTKKIILSVGTIEPRKRYDVIVDGFRLSGLVDKGYVLVCVGKVGWKVDRFVDEVKISDDYERSIFLLQDISDRELADLYDACELLVFASDVEGFGLPLVEARTKGKRVLASDIPVFREIADHGVSFFEPGNALSLAEQLTDVLSIQTPPGVMEWITWDAASRDFLLKIKNLASLKIEKSQ